MNYHALNHNPSPPLKNLTISLLSPPALFVPNPVLGNPPFPPQFFTSFTLPLLPFTLPSRTLPLLLLLFVKPKGDAGGFGLGVCDGTKSSASKNPNPCSTVLGLTYSPTSTPISSSIPFAVCGCEGKVGESGEGLAMDVD